MENEDIIFQVKINRTGQEFELVKKELTPFEQSDFILFLESYVDAMKEMKVVYMKEVYALDDHVDED